MVPLWNCDHRTDDAAVRLKDTDAKMFAAAVLVDLAPSLATSS